MAFIRQVAAAPKSLHHPTGERQIGGRDQRAGQFERQSLGHGGSGECQPTGKLTAGIAGDGDRGCGHAGGGDSDRRALTRAARLGLEAKGPEGGQQIANRTLPHPRRAVEPVAAVAEAGEGRQESHGGAAGLAVDGCRGSRNLTATAGHGQAMTGPVGLDCKAEGREPGHHHPGVVTVEYSRQAAGAPSQGRTDDRPVGDAL